MAGQGIRSVRIRNFGPIIDLTWTLDDEAPGPGWHVILGDNGAGKTSVLKAVALGLLGSHAALSLRIEPSAFVRRGAASTSVRMDTSLGTREWSAKASKNVSRPPAAGFHASFGSTRRLVGGKELNRLETSDPVSSRHASLFDPNWSLGDIIQWLKDLRIDGQAELSRVMRFVNQRDLLPDVQLVEVTRKGPVFEDASGLRHGMEALSDGYQSAVGLTLEILRQLWASHPIDSILESDGDRVVVAVPGIVLIDEVDAHLHPTWQQRIGFFFTRHFPHFQFLVTTHSPLVCRAAEHGSIYRLPAPGLATKGAMLLGQDRARLLYGDVLDAFGTEVFGRDVTRGELGQAKFDRLADLNVQARFGKLEEAERLERGLLQNLLLAEPE